MESYQLPRTGKTCSIKTLLVAQGISSTHWRRIKKSGQIFINEEPASISRPVQPGDLVSFNLAEPVSSIIPEKHELQIVYEDADLIVLDKPAGILVHPTTSTAVGTLSNYLAGYYLQKQIVAGIHPVSRLDRNTSGLVLFVKKSQWQYQLPPNTLHKEYLAILQGVPPASSGSINGKIARKPGSIIERMISPDGKEAHSLYHVLAVYGSLALVQFSLLTGRTHQIRVHAASLGSPLYGDNLYGTPGPQARHALHSWRLSFLHPRTKALLQFSSPLPEDLLAIIRQNR